MLLEICILARHVIIHDRFRFFDSGDCLDVLKGNPSLLIFGAGQVGAIVSRELAKAGLRPIGFVDNNSNSKTFCELPVWRPDKAAAQFPDAVYVIAVTIVENIARQLLRHGIEKGFSIGFSDGLSKTWSLADAGSSRELPPQIAFLQCAEYHKSLLLFPESIRSGLALELPITERCSLRCLDCGNLMQYYPQPEHLPIDVLKRDLGITTGCLDYIPEIRIIGGEPLLHPDFAAIASMAAQKSNVGHVGIVTNGTRIPSADQFAALRNDKIYFRISDYGSLSNKLGRLLEECEKHAIPAFVLKNPSWLRCRLTPAQGLDTEILRARFRSCSSMFCLTMMRGKLFHCEYAANGERIGGIPENRANSVDLLSDSGDPKALAKKIWTFIHKCEMLPACDYCLGFSQESRQVTPAVQAKSTLLLPGLDRE